MAQRPALTIFTSSHRYITTPTSETSEVRRRLPIRSSEHPSSRIVSQRTTSPVTLPGLYLEDLPLCLSLAFDEGQAGSVTASQVAKCTLVQMSVTNPHAACAQASIQQNAEVTAPGRLPEGGFPPARREKLTKTVLISTSGS